MNESTAVMPSAMPREPKYQPGRRVQALIHLYNDGSYPDQPSDALLVRQGDNGEIVQVGMHVDSGTPLYMVQFGDLHVVGCLEEEIAIARGSHDDVEPKPKS